MLGIKWRELFPTKWSVIIFIAYMSLFVNQGIIVTASQSSDKRYNYSTTLVVLLTEVLKLITSVVLYCKNEKIITMFKVIKNNFVLLALYFVPSLLYCFYNNLSFINLVTFDPTTYYLLLQFRVVITALLFQIIFKKNLSSRQWISLLMLTVGCMIKHMDYGGSTETILPGSRGSGGEKNITGNTHIWSQMLSLSAMLILVQCFCSSLAGVYNEYLLKSRGLTVDIYIQNIFMYLDSIICNVVVIVMQGKSGEVFNVQSLGAVLRINVIIIMINSTMIGIVTSFFLKTMNSILKTFASALELVFTAIACYLIFGIIINWFTVLSILIVSISVILYSQNPVDNHAKSVKAHSDQVHLLVEGEEV